MQSSLFFAEHQSVFNEVQKNIQNADEQSRATWAEYINKTVSKERRNNRDFTAEDVKNNTDNVAWQLAVYRYVPAMFNLDAAVVDLDTAQESGIADVMAKQGAESGAVIGTNASVIGTNESVVGTGKAVTETGESVIGEEQYSLSKTKTDRLKGVISELGNKRISKQAGDKKITIQTDDYTVNKNIYSDKGRKKSEVNARIKNIDNFEQLLNQSEYVGTDTEIRDVDKDAKKGVIAMHRFKTSIDGFDIEFLVRDKGKSQYLYEAKFLENKKGSQQSITDNAVSSAPEGDVENDNIVSQNESVVNPESKKISSNDAIDEKGKNSRSDAINAEGKQTGAETVQGETAGASPRPTGEFDGEADLDRAKRDAERMIEWEKKNAPTAEELNRVREYVKGFDSLPANRQLAIVRMIRSSEGVDADMVRGVANLMAITNRKGAVLAPDLEFRFAELADDVAKRGIKTEVGGKTVIVLNTNSTYKDSIRGSIAHEIVHYLENRKGYKALADFAMKHAKADKVAEVRETYKDVYKGENAEAKIEGEVVASVVAEMLNSEKFLKRYAQMGEEQGSVIKRIARFVKGIANSLKDKDNKASAVATDMMNLVDKALGSEVAREKTGTEYDISNKKIAIGMSDSERAQILKNTKLDVVEFKDENAELNGKEVLKLKSTYKSQAEKILRELAAKFEVFADYSNDNVELEFNYSRRSLGESVHKQNDRAENKSQADFYDFARMLYVFEDVVKNAQPIEVHSDKYVGTKREDSNLKQMFVLLSAFKDGKFIIPVEFNIKEFSNHDKNKLYVSVTLQKIEADLMEHPPQHNVATKNSKSTSTYSIADIIKNVNPLDKYFLKYVPDSLLNAEQIIAKNEAINEDQIRIGDMRYEYAVENNPSLARDMLIEKSNREGYVNDTEWRINHKAPDSHNDTTHSLDQIDKVYGNDGSIYSKYALDYYGEGRSYDWKTIRVIQSARNNPEKMIKIYRAVPLDVKDTRVRNGDWVTIVKEYADEHGYRWLDGKYRIIENEVPAKHLYTNGDSINEFGYDNGNTNEVYKNTPNNVKTTEITYDDNGNIIPLSKRFDSSEPDIRYDLDPEAVKREAEKQKKETATKEASKGIKTGSAEAGRFAKGLSREFGLNKAAEETIRSKLEALEEVFINGDREAYIEEYRKKVEEIFDIVSREAIFEVTTDKVYERFQTYMRGKRFRVDKRFRQSMGREEWNGVYSVIRGRLASDKNTTAPHVDSLYAELNELFPDLFSSEIINVHDQLERIAKVMLDAKNAQSEEFDFSQLPDEWQGSVAIDVVDRINSFITRVSSNRDSLKIIKAEKNELLKMLKKERSLREKMAREEANAAKAERARQSLRSFSVKLTRCRRRSRSLKRRSGRMLMRWRGFLWIDVVFFIFLQGK